MGAAKANTKNKVEKSGGVFAPSIKRIIGLDLLRISLAILIYMFHSKMHMGINYSFLNPFVGVGAIAMTGFFMLSGYSLRLVYGEQNLMEKKNLLRFYLKRMLGILPMYYFVAVLYIFTIGKESIVENVLLFPIEALGIQSTFSSLFGVSHNGGTWFISCLLIAYLIYPFLQTIYSMLSAKQKGITLVTLYAIEIWAAIVSQHFDTATLYDNPFYRIIEFSCGMIIADINIECDSKIINLLRSKLALTLSIIILLVGVSLMRNFLRVGDYMQYNWIVLPCFVILFFSSGSIKIPWLENVRSIGYFGKVSYAFFLVQFFAWPIGKWAVKTIGWDSNGFKMAITFAFCVIVSILMYELVQRPVDMYLKPKLLRR